MTTYIDAHCHLHDHLSVELYLSVARNNFRRLIAVQESFGSLNLMLCLADYPGAEGFMRIRESVNKNGLSGWRIRPTEEAESLLLEHCDGDRLWVIAGLQVVTAERLEVMAIGTTKKVPDRLVLDEVLQQLAERKALAVLPWGVGKWWGRRGRIVTAALEHYGRNLLLCDNGGRPWLWRPRLLTIARNLGIPVLSGTDPLRIKGDCLRSGSFGIRLAEAPPSTAPSAWLIGRLRLLSIAPEVLGHPLKVWPFIRNQVALRREVKPC